MELERIQNEIKIEKDPLEDEHECFSEESKLDQYQIEENWVKVWKDWELENENWMSGKKVENEIGRIVVSLSRRRC